MKVPLVLHTQSGHVTQRPSRDPRQHVCVHETRGESHTNGPGLQVKQLMGTTHDWQQPAILHIRREVSVTIGILCSCPSVDFTNALFLGKEMKMALVQLSRRHTQPGHLTRRPPSDPTSAGLKGQTLTPPRLRRCPQRTYEEFGP